MRTRIQGSERTREALNALIDGQARVADAKSELVRLATRLIIEEGLEGEVRDALGRDYYEHGSAPGGGYRNGTREGHLKTAEGRIDYAAPQVAGTVEPFRSELRAHLKGHSEGLEGLAVEMLARGLSVRDIEDAFRDESGRLLLSRTAVSEMGARLWEDDQNFATRDLSEYEIAYLFVDGIAERLRAGHRREPVLAAWSFTVEGKKVLLHLMAGSKEDHETVSAFFQDMRARTGRSLAGGLRWRAWDHQGAGDLLPALGPPALPGASDAQPGGQGAGGDLARAQDPCPGLLPGAVAQDRPGAG